MGITLYVYILYINKYIVYYNKRIVFNFYILIKNPIFVPIFSCDKILKLFKGPYNYFNYLLYNNYLFIYFIL